MYLLSDWSLLRAYETNPETPAGENEVATQEQGGGAQSPDVLRRDEWQESVNRINERFDQIGQSIKEGFEGWTNRQNQGDVEGEPDSSSEETQEEVEVVVQDRETVRNRHPRTKLSIGAILRRLAE